MANSETFYLVADLGAEQPDFRREALEYENPPLRQSWGQGTPPRGRQCGQNADGVRGVLPAAGGACRQSEGRDRHGAQAGGALLQYLAVWHGLSRSGGCVLRSP